MYSYSEDKWIAKSASDPRSNDELINALRTELDNEIWPDMLVILQARRDPELIRRALEYCKSADPTERWIGTGILAQTGAGSQKILEQECIEALLDRVLNDEDADVLASASSGLSDYEDPRISASLARLKNHSDSDVRFAVMQGLQTREDSVAIDTLIELTSDSDDDVRNWSTFGLAQMIDADNPDIREALMRRTNDEKMEVRAEALLGLARRKDTRVVDLLISEFKVIIDADEYWDMVFEAVEEYPTSQFYPSLMEVIESGITNERLDRAIALCRIPNKEEGNDKSTKARTSCPVCMLKNSFKRSVVYQFCKRCGWEDDLDQIINQDDTNRYRNNCRSLNQERERWQKRLEEAKR